MSYTFSQEQLGADLPASPIARAVAPRFKRLGKKSLGMGVGVQTQLRRRTWDGTGSTWRATRPKHGGTLMQKRAELVDRSRYGAPLEIEKRLEQRKRGLRLGVKRAELIRVAKEGPILTGGAGASYLADVGFSLKPPKWIRKAQPGKILKKIAVPLAIGAGTLLVPGAGTLAAKGIVGAAKLALGAGKGIVKAGGLFGKLLAKKAAGPVAQAAVESVLPTSEGAATESVVAPAIVQQVPQQQTLFSPAVSPTSEEVSITAPAVTPENAPTLAGSTLALGIGAGVIALAMLTSGRRK